jgi:pterin-4a-carbinolamine dehydratase
LRPLGRDNLRDALSQLTEWAGDAQEIRRTMRLDDGEHAALAERIKVLAEAMQVDPLVRRRNGHTQVTLRAPKGTVLTQDEVRLAARIEDAYRAVIHPA